METVDPAAREPLSSRSPGPDTRSRILEAAIDLLVDRGNSGFSTRLVASRAGVSQGAVQHHFRSRADLCVSAMSLLLERISVEFIEAVPPIDDPIQRFEMVADRLFALFRGPTFMAGLELRLAARTDPDLRGAMMKLDGELDRILADGASAMFPELTGRSGFDALLEATLASVRGLAVANLDPDSDPDRSWRSVRSVLRSGAVDVFEGARR